ncbi:DUF3866 family protein [Paenibacillus sp. UNC451MF]|uniref:DUF3866 family protein n=1 Tax=Paenibacillus sp. UNC451MF TaxID=1449063 RepID=UPI00048B0586|nr:DUF3866 family protein [Paenibacillus sp. UNC451MF]
MIKWRTAVVTEISTKDFDLYEITVRFNDGTKGIAVYYGDDHAISLKVDDEVLLNTTAVALGLGTGGVHFVHKVLSRGVGGTTSELSSSDSHNSAYEANTAAGHIMKLRYTSLQRPVLAVEEQSSPFHELFTQELTLEGMPVLVGELHSMLPMLLCRLRQRMGEEGIPLRIAYIMTDSAALPLAFSKHVRHLKQLGWLIGCITYGQAYGGDLEAVNKYTALLAAKHVLQADLAIVLPGPGSVGTETLMGFSGTEASELLNAVGVLQGLPIAIPRISFADERERHRGISHHTLTVLRDLTLIRANVPLPLLTGDDGARVQLQAGYFELASKHALTWHVPVSDEQWQRALSEYRLPITSMGRGLLEDPAFWSAMSAAADLAWHYATIP